MKVWEAIYNVVVKLFIVAMIAIVAVTIVSCSKGDEPEPKPEPTEDPIEYTDELLSLPGWSMANEGLEDRSDEIKYFDQSDENVDVDYEFKLEKSVPGSIIANPQDYVKVYDSEHIVRELVFTEDESNPDVLIVKSARPYEKGRYYTVDLYNTGVLHFYEKDPTITEFHFDISREKTIVENYKSNAKVYEFLLSDLVSCDEVTEAKEGQTYFMEFKKPMRLKLGDQFLIWNGVEKTADSFYGTFVNEVVLNNLNYKIEFTAPDLSKIFDEDNGIDYHIEGYSEGELKDLELPTQREIEQAVLDSGVMDYFTNQYLTLFPDDAVELDTPTWLKILQSVSIKPKIGLKWPGVSFQLNVDVTFPLKYGDVILGFEFYRMSTYKSDASFKLRKFWGIPYWADLTCDITETIDTSFKFSVGLLLHAEKKPKSSDKDTLSETILSNLWDMEDADTHLKKYNDMKNDIGVDGNTLRIPLLKGKWPIGVIFDIFLDLNFDIKIEPQCMFQYNYSVHNVNHILQYRSNDSSKTSSNTEEYKTSTHSIALGGSLNIDVGVHLEFGVGVCGLEKWIHISIYLNVGFYMKLTGYVVWSWSASPGGSKNSSGGVCGFEVGFYINGGISVAFFFVDFKVEIFGKRIPFFSTQTDCFILEIPDIGEAKLNLSKGTIDLAKETNFLNLSTFDLSLMRSTIKNFDPSMKVKVDGKEQNLYTLTLANGNYCEVKDGKVILKSGAPVYFEDKLYVDVPKSMYKDSGSKAHFLEIPLIYISKDARLVKIDGEDFGYFKLGSDAQLTKTPKAKDKYEFYGYKNKKTGEIFALNAKVTVQDTDNEYESVYTPLIQHKVTFYDGAGNIIKQTTYRHGEQIVAPTAQEASMAGWDFVKWSEEFDKANYAYNTQTYEGSDIKIYGVYIKASINV